MRISDWSSDVCSSDLVLPRIAQMATATSVAYALLTLGCAAAYAFAGMTAFEAVTHAMSTVSTGGYSTYDASLGHFANPAIEGVAMGFMLLGALTLVIHIQIAHGRGGEVWNHRQVRDFLAIVLAVSHPVDVWFVVLV